MKKLSVVLCVRNEEKNLDDCLKSVNNLADEIVVVDEKSSDSSVKIAQKYGAKIIEVEHRANFHINKQKAIDAASCDWILQLDADERVTEKLADEIKGVINMDYQKLLKRKPLSEKQSSLFERHRRLIEKREGELGMPSGEIVAFFIPRLNYFLNKPLRNAGLYPDGVIRLVKRGKARLPGKSVHELMQVDGEIAWLFNDLEHHDSPTFERYLNRANRYTDLTAEEYKADKLPLSYWNLFYFSFVKPIVFFLKLFVIHRGYRDGMRGFIWSVFSALHYPISYFKYWQGEKS